MADRDELDLSGIDQKAVAIILSLAERYARWLPKCGAWEFRDLVQSGVVGALKAYQKDVVKTGYLFTKIKKEMMDTVALKCPVSGRGVRKAASEFTVRSLEDVADELYTREPEPPPRARLGYVCRGLPERDKEALGKSYGVLGYQRLLYTRAGEGNRVRKRAKVVIKKLQAKIAARATISASRPAI